MPNFLMTMFGSNETYMNKYVSEKNRMKTFPVRELVRSDEFIRGVMNDSVLISGGCDEERSTCITGLIRTTPGCTVVLHNGNHYLSADKMRNYGINALNWDTNIYAGLSKNKVLSMLVGDDKDPDLAFFYAFAFDVCEVMGVPITIEKMCDIDWLGIGWQQIILQNSEQKCRAFDLLARYDSNMAEKAVKGVCKLERLSRAKGCSGSGISEAFSNGRVIVKEVYGSNSEINRQCLEIIRAKAEEGQKFTLVLDDIYLDVSIINDNYRNVRLILSGEDITQYSPDMSITNRSCNIVIFNHSNYSSCETISRTYFGNYDRFYCETSSGYSKSFLEPKVNNRTVTVRQERDARLKPEMIATIQMGCAFVRLKNGAEGYISLK